MEYYIYITNKCNLNCSYCSVMMDPHQTTIPDEINYSIRDLKTFIDKKQKSVSSKDNTACIYFFGGEPTLNYPQISDIIKLFDNRTDYTVKFVLHTNGLLLDIIPFDIISKVDVIFLSLNYEKIFNKGLITSYFYKIIRTISELKSKYNIITIGRFTVSNNTSLYTEATMSGLFFDYVYWQLDNQQKLSNLDTYKERYKNDIAILIDYWIRYLENGVVLRYVPFLSVTKHLLSKSTTPTHYYCGFGEDIVFIQTDGSCYGCCDNIVNKKYLLGNIYDGIKYSDMEIDEHCASCQYIKLCGGRCGRMHKDFEQWRIDDFCEMNVFSFKLLQESLPRIKKAIQKKPELWEAFVDTNIEYTEQIP